MATRDTSGLWDKNQKTPPDRSTGIAPPQRSKRQQTPTPSVDVGAVPTTKSAEPAAAPKEPAPPTTEGDTKLLALSFTSDQMDWIRQTSSKRGLWAGELFEEIFIAHHRQIADTGVGPRTRRRNANYTGTRFTVPIALYNDFTALVAELRTSNAALGRAVVDAERR